MALPVLAPLPSIIPAHSVNLFSGAPGVGKTAFLVWLIQQLIEGRAIFGHQPNPIPFTGIICTDRSWRESTKLWFDLYGLAEFPHYSMLDDSSFQVQRLRKKQDRMSILNQFCDKLSPAGDGQFPAGSLIFVDPIALFLGGNLIDYDACAVACCEIREIARQRDVSFVGVCHTPKQKNDKKDQYRRLQDRIMGSTGLTGYTDTAFYLASPEEIDVPHYTFLWAPHHVPTASFKFERDGHGRFVPMGEAPMEDEEALSSEAMQEVLAVLSEDRPTLTAQVLKALPELSRATVHRRLDALARSGLIQRVAQGRYRKARTQ